MSHVGHGTKLCAIAQAASFQVRSVTPFEMKGRTGWQYCGNSRDEELSLCPPWQWAPSRRTHARCAGMAGGPSCPPRAHDSPRLRCCHRSRLPGHRCHRRQCPCSRHPWAPAQMRSLPEMHSSLAARQADKAVQRSLKRPQNGLQLSTLHSNSGLREASTFEEYLLHGLARISPRRHQAIPVSSSHVQSVEPLQSRMRLSNMNYRQAHLHGGLKKACPAGQNRLHALRRNRSRMRPAIPPAAQPRLGAPPQHCAIRIVVHLQELPSSALAQDWSLNAPCQATNPQRSPLCYKSWDFPLLQFCGSSTARPPGHALRMLLLAQAGHGAGACLNRLPRLCCDRLGVQHLPLHCPAPPEGSGLQWHDSSFMCARFRRDSPHKVCNIR